MPERHQLIYLGSTRSGAAVWQCPRCQARMLTRQWPPFAAEVLVEGDPGVAHSGRFGEAMAGRRPLPGPASRLTPAERSWLDHNGIDWDGPDSDEPAA